MSKLIKSILIGLIDLYQKIKKNFIMPYKGPSCRFYPTCSNYSKEAIEKYGPFKGTFLSIIRILRCNPFSKGGYDPLR